MASALIVHVLCSLMKAVCRCPCDPIHLIPLASQFSHESLFCLRLRVLSLPFCCTHSDTIQASSAFVLWSGRLHQRADVTSQLEHPATTCVMAGCPLASRGRRITSPRFLCISKALGPLRTMLHVSPEVVRGSQHQRQLCLA